MARRKRGEAALSAPGRQDPMRHGALPGVELFLRP